MGNYTCPKCNQNIKYGVKYCPHCGTPLVWGQSNDSNQQKKTNDNTADGLYSTCFWLIFIIAIGYGFWYCYSKMSEAFSPLTEKVEKKTLQGTTCSFVYYGIKMKLIFEDSKRGTLYIDANSSPAFKDPQLLNNYALTNGKATLKFSYDDLEDYVWINVSDTKVLDMVGLSSYFLLADGYIYQDGDAANARDTAKGVKCTVTNN